MISEASTLTTCVLLSLAALQVVAAAATADDVEGARVEWCSRVCSGVCPQAPPSPSSPPSTTSPPSLNLTCPEPRCPQPVCPAPKCPQPSSRTSSQPWKALQTYNATDLGFYKAYTDKSLDWFEAQMLCEEEGAHLVIINSVEEDRFVRENMILSPGWIHIGVHDLIREGERMTVLGEPVSSTGFNKWLYGHLLPNPKTNCGWIKRTFTGMGMGPCSDKGPFVCELSIGS